MEEDREMRKQRIKQEKNIQIAEAREADMDVTRRAEPIARVCHEANRAYCLSIGDASQVPWDEAPDWQRTSAIDGVRHRLYNPDAPASVSHDRWLTHKQAEGWTYGPVKDPERKQHPCMVPYEQLPAEQQRKDALFVSIVEALR